MASESSSFNQQSAPTSTSTPTANSSTPSIAIPSYFPLDSAHSAPPDSEPTSPNGISAAATLATLSSDSRPPTSHGEDAEELIDADDTGGISLASAQPPPFAQYHTPGIPAGFSQLVMDLGTHISLHPHAVAFEDLSMEQLPTPPLSTAPPAIPDTLALPLPNSGHQGWAPSFVDHLSIQDSAAFEDIESFLLYFPAQHLRKTAFLSSDRADQKSAINKEDLDGEKCDFQGMDWTECTSRSNIRSKRAAYERSRLQTKIYEGHGMSHTHQLRNRDNFFSFRRMNTTHRAHCPHFQLRNVMTATSRNDVFYATRDALLRTDAQGSPAVPIINLNKQKVNGNKSQITTLAAQNDVLVAGGFEGDYMITDLTSGLDTRAHFGLIKDWAPDAKSYIANHVHLFPSRSSYAPQAVLCSNDSRLRVLDCMTDTFRYTFAYPSAVNCSATSPDGRMRVVVGDFQETFITNAETGLPFETLSAHVDDAFACAWADDGIHVATAAQDSTIVVWDARFWRRPLTVMPSELSIPRVLKFSPVGSGPRVLIAAEADDYVNIINAQTWDSKQVFDFFGPMAGVSMTPDGQSLFIANTERRFGGLIELERTQWGGTTCAKLRDDAFYDEEYIDWSGDGEMNVDMRVSGGWNERARRGLGLGDLVV